MSGQSHAGFLSVRPMLSRTRSSTSPAAPSDRNIDAAASTGDLRTPPRPGVGRSQSYVSSVERKPPPTVPLPSIPSEKPLESSRFPRLHLPGKLHHGSGEETKAVQQKRHRYTQSESQQYQRKDDVSRSEDSSSATPTQYFGLPADLLYPSSRGGAIPSLMRIRSQRSHRPQPSVDEKTSSPRVRSNSDPKSPINSSESAQPKTSIQRQLDRADLLRYAAHQNATKSDIDRIDSQLKTSEAELSKRVVGDIDKASAIMQKLDHAHDNLHRTAESLLDTLSSFSSLAQQSSQLLTNFEKETKSLDTATRQRISKHQKQVCTIRAENVAKLERRGRIANEKAESLVQRLENCRTIVDNWQRRETKKRKTWKGVRNGIIWGVILILISAFAGYLSWEAVQISKGEGTPAQRLTGEVKNSSWSDDIPNMNGDGEKSETAMADLPDDVRAILRDIADREKHGTRPLLERTSVNGDAAAKGKKKKALSEKQLEKTIHLLDEL